MKRILTILCLSLTYFISAQEIKHVEMCDLKFETNKDSTEMTVSKNGKLLAGKYKISGVFPEQHSLTEFINGKAEGKSITVYNGIVIREKHFKNGLPNGIWTEFDDSGENVLRKIYYWNGKRVSKNEYEKNNS